MAARLPGPQWLQARRRAAAERFAASELPSEAEEIWRYSRISHLDLDAYSPVLDADGSADPPQEIGALITAAGRHAACVIVRNGRISSVSCEPGLAARGLTVGDAAAMADGPELLDDEAPPLDVFGELNTAFVGAPVVVRVPPGLVVEDPILVLHWIDADGAATFPRTVVAAGADSEATVVEHHGSADVAAFSAPVVRLSVGDAARLSYLGVQDLGRRVFQVATQESRVGRDALLQSSAVALGGDYARLRNDSCITGKGGTTRLSAAYFTDGTRMHDFRTLQDHAAPASTSDLLFKGAVSDVGRSVYSGLIRISKDAPGTNAFQTNRNLVLSEGAAAESVPNLEIETDDVRCSHASAVGPIDEEQRYYLEARGIPPEVTERLIVMGFLGEVLDRLPTPSLVAGLRSAIAGRLAARP